MGLMNFPLPLWILCSVLLLLHAETVQGGCGYPGAPAHSILSFSTDDIGPGTVATYECEGGFELLGPLRRTCQENNTWTPLTIPFCVLNVAAGKAPMQSSIHQNGTPQKAVDGSTSAFFSEGTCTQTAMERTPWWYVNLLESYMIQLVRIDFGRPCCADDQPASIVVRVGNNRPDLGVNPICGKFTGFIEEGVPLFIPCSPPLPGAFVSIHMETPRGGALSICETFVYTDQALPIESCPSFRDQPLGSTATFNGRCYIFYNNHPMTFEHARRLCHERGGSLVDEASPPLQGFISWELWRRHRNNPNGQYWMGAIRDPRDRNNWKWINGQDVSVSYWNLPGGNDNCSRYDGTKGWLWSDTDCNLNLNYICQNRPVRCGIPQRPPNSTILTTTNDFKVDTIVEYHCAPGHILIGNSARSCLTNGFYTDTAPTCKYLECGIPVEILHGRFTFLNGTRYYRSVIQYTCNDGYILMGEKFLSCDIQQMWNGPPPRCEPATCPQPLPIANGSYRMQNNTTTFGTVLEYACNHPGYRLNGASRLRCNSDGHWDKKPPTCIGVSQDGNSGDGNSVIGAGSSLPPTRPSAPTSKPTTTTSTTTTTRTTIRSSPPPPPLPYPPPTRPLPSTSPKFGERLGVVNETFSQDVTDNIIVGDKMSTPSHFIRPYFPDAAFVEKIDTGLSPSTQTPPRPTTIGRSTHQPIPTVEAVTTSRPPPHSSTSSLPTTHTSTSSTTSSSPTRRSDIIFPENTHSNSVALPKASTRAKPATSTTKRVPIFASTRQSQTIMSRSTTSRPATTARHTEATPSPAIRPSPFIPHSVPSRDPSPPLVPFDPFHSPGHVSDDIPPTSSNDHSDEESNHAVKPEVKVSVGSSNVPTGSKSAATQKPKANMPESEVQTDGSGHSNTKLNLGGIIALSVFGGFVVLAALTTMIVVMCRRSRHSAGSLDNTTISTDDSLSSESRGLNKYYKRAWENLRADSKSNNGGLGPNLHRMGDVDKHTSLSRQETLDNPNYRASTGTIEGLRDTNEMTVNDATAWNTRTDHKDRRHNGHHHHHHHHHHRRSGSPDSIEGQEDNLPTSSPWQNKHRRH